MHINVHKGSAACLLVMSGSWMNRSIEPVEPVHQIKLNRLKWFRLQYATISVSK